MKTLTSSQLIRNALIAVTAMSLPIMASASQNNVVVSFTKSDLENTRGAERIYEQMKHTSSELCGSSRITRSIQESVSSEKCFTGTLTAAVKRLNNPAITALHCKS